jgi:hypothetical protein
MWWRVTVPEGIGASVSEKERGRGRAEGVEWVGMRGVPLEE